MERYGFGDESGNPSRKEPIRKPYFAVGCLVTEDYPGLLSAMREYRAYRGWSPYHEFSFNDTHVRTQREFLTLMSELPLRASVLVVDKRMIQTPYGVLSTRGVYKRGLALAVDQAVGVDTVRKVTLDTFFGNKVDNNNLKSYLRHEINRPLHRVSEFDIDDSYQVDGIQAIDMITGAVAHLHTTGDAQFRSILKDIVTECHWPEDE